MNRPLPLTITCPRCGAPINAWCSPLAGDDPITRPLHEARELASIPIDPAEQEARETAHILNSLRYTAHENDAMGVRYPTGAPLHLETTQAEHDYAENMLKEMRSYQQHIGAPIGRVGHIVEPPMFMVREVHPPEDDDNHDWLPKGDWSIK